MDVLKSPTGKRAEGRYNDGFCAQADTGQGPIGLGDEASAFARFRGRSMSTRWSAAKAGASTERAVLSAQREGVSWRRIDAPESAGLPRAFLDVTLGADSSPPFLQRPRSMSGFSWRAPVLSSDSPPVCCF